MYRIAICDDDIAYTEYLEKKIKEVLGKSERSSICKYYSGEEFIGDLELEFDLVFLDMQMGEIDGITAAIKFRKRNQDAVLVFCTGIQLPQPEFFDVQPFRYLMKNYTENKMDEELKNIINKMIENKKEVYIVVRNDGRMDKIAIDNITYISNIKRGCCIHMFSKKDNQCYEFASNKKLIDSALLYSGLMVEVSGINEGILLVGCILLLFANAIIFFLYEYIFRLNYENQALEMLTLKTDLEKKYYDRMEKVNLEQSNYMHDLKFMLRTIGNLAVQDQNEEITSVIQNMKIRIGAMEEEFFCKNKVLNTILCEKKKEAIDNKINYQAYVEPGIPLDFIQDIDIIIIMGNIIDNAIEATKKIDYGYIDINVFATQKGHFLMIRVENKFDGIVKKKGDDFCSTKQEPDKHGIGLKNVADCVNKYGGILQIDVNDNIFTVSVIFTVL